jgi:hypothetical protein
MPPGIDLNERTIVVVRVAGLSALASHDPPCTPVRGARRVHGELSIVPFGLPRELTLAISKYGAILGRRKRASTLDAVQGPVNLRPSIRIFEREQPLSAPGSPHAASLLSDARGNFPADACPESVRVLSSSLPLCVAKRSRWFASASMLTVWRTTLF